MNCKSANVLSQGSGVMCGRVCHKESEFMEALGGICILQEMGKVTKISVCGYEERLLPSLPQKCMVKFVCCSTP